MRRGWLLVAVGLLSCARALPPPGGEPDRDAPRLVSTKPEQRAIVPDFNEKVVFTFDDKLGERGLRDAVMVSPETGRPTLERHGSELHVAIEGGWRPNTIYRVVILPTIMDRFNNTRREPAELVFSTGPPLIATALGGLVTDRLTGRPVPMARVHAINTRDSTRHTTVTDTAGFFGIGHLPLARYTIRAFEDANRNNQMDRAERRAEGSRNIGAVGDTQTVELALLAPDTTSARLIRAEARDSVEVRLFFDDYLDPDQPLSAVTAVLFQMPDSTPVPGNVRVLTPRAADRARAVRDSVAAAADTAAARRPRLPPTQLPDTSRVLPTQELVMMTPSPLAPRTRYRVVVSGVRNIAGRSNGGGSVSFTTRPRVETPAIRRDTGDARALGRAGVRAFGIASSPLERDD